MTTSDILSKENQEPATAVPVEGEEATSKVASLKGKEKAPIETVSTEVEEEDQSFKLDEQDLEDDDEEEEDEEVLEGEEEAIPDGDDNEEEEEAKDVESTVTDAKKRKLSETKDEEEEEEEEEPEEEVFDEEEMAELDSNNIIQGGRRTRGKRIDFKSIIEAEESSGVAVNEDEE